MTSYDEDLRDNPFHRELLKSHIDLVERASQEGWIVCVPRRATVQVPVTSTDIFEHILIPNDNSNTSRTLNKTEIIFTNDCIDVRPTNGSSSCVRVLFKETFYLHHLKYTVYCVESPLNQKLGADFRITHVTTLKDCIDLLRFETNNSDVLINISDSCEEFLLMHEDIHSCTLQELKDLCNVLYTKCLLLALKYHSLQKRTTTDKVLLGNLQIAVETYSQHCFNNQVFDAVCTNTLHMDSIVNKNTRNLQYIQPNQLDVLKFQDSISSAKYELSKLNRSSTTLGKLLSLKRTFHALSDNGRQNLTTDDLMQLMAFLIINVDVNNWVANLVYLQQFNFSSSSEHDERAFLLTTFEAALEYVKSDILFKLDPVTDCNQNEILKIVRSADLELIEATFKDKPEFELKKLCHPLCSCDNCSQSLHSTEYTVEWCDDKGRNVLHFASLYGFPYVVDFFIHKGVNVCGIDHLGSAPVHYASSHGHQNALLLLLHSGADLNVADAEGNTALHLASKNGHESCVKALLYYSEHADRHLDVNSQNSQGNTALHLAVNWGYLNIIATLLQYNANPDIRNKKNQRIIDLCHNYRIKKSILNKVKGVVACNSHKSTLRCFGIRPKDFHQFKKIELLLKAVENNDLPLSCFYLAIPVPPSILEDKNTCHPLCCCERCCEITEDDSYTRPKPCLNVNMCNSNGFTALHVAAKFGRNEILRLLLDSSANVNVQTYRLLQTPLHLACINLRLHAVKELLKSGACNVDAQDAKGCTAIHHAAMKNDVKILDALLVCGCDASIKNYEGKTALQVAQEMTLNNVVTLIKEKSCVAVLADDGFMS